MFGHFGGVLMALPIITSIL